MGEFRSTRALAVLNLRTTAEGGIRHAWPAYTPSFLFWFNAVQFGAFIFTADAEPLQPGDVERDVELLFWVPPWSANTLRRAPLSPSSTATAKSATAPSSSRRQNRLRSMVPGCSAGLGDSRSEPNENDSELITGLPRHKKPGIALEGEGAIRV